MPRYLLVNGQNSAFAKVIAKEDLGDVLLGRLETIIDIQEQKYFDAENNVWLKVRVRK